MCSSDLFTCFWGDGRVEREDFTSASTVPGKAYWGSSHQRCIEDFYRCALNNEPFRNDIPGIKNTVELMLSVYEAARGN